MYERKESAAQTELCDYRGVGDGAKRKDSPDPMRRGQFGGEKAAASRDLGRLRLILRRNTTHGIGDACPVEHETIIGPGIVDTSSKPEFPQRIVEERTRVITSERSPGAVRSF
jgi:hypothetical protein